MKNLDQQIELVKKQHAELLEAKENYLNELPDITIMAMGALLTKLGEGVDELLEGIANTKYYDKDLGSTIKSTISEAITTISKIQPPQVNITPQINVDFKPLQRISEDISKGQNTLISLIEQMNNGNGSDELMRLITAVTNRQLAFLEKGIQQIDITPQLKNISEGINKRPTEWEASVIEWNGQGRLSKMKIKVTK